MSSKGFYLFEGEESKSDKIRIGKLIQLKNRVFIATPKLIRVPLVVSFGWWWKFEAWYLKVIHQKKHVSSRFWILSNNITKGGVKGI